MLDIERLLEINSDDRTTKMLVDAIQNTVTGQHVVVAGYNYAYCVELARRAYALALDMHYPVRYIGRHTCMLQIDGVPMMFVPKDVLELKTRGLDCVVFEDHFKG